MTVADGALRDIAASFRITGPTSFELAGRSYGDFERHGASNEGLVEEAERQLQLALYDVLHCRSDARRYSAPNVIADHHSSMKFVEALSLANESRRRVTRWAVIHADRRSVVAEYWGILFHLEKRHIRPFGGAQREIAVRMPKEQRGIAPGFYVALSERDDDSDGGANVRVYWHVDASGAPQLVRCLTSKLNRAGLAFRLKVLADPWRYSRADAATLYLATTSFRAALPSLRACHDEVATCLYPEVSHLALRLADGVSLAENPAHEGSFGEDRCQRLARALVSVAQDTDLASNFGFNAFLRQLGQMGLDPARMYVNPGSRHSYRWDGT